MKLQSIYMNRESYGPNSGKLVGSITFATPGGKVELAMGEKQCERICAAMAENVVEVAQEVADNLVANVFENVNLAIESRVQ